MLMLFLKPSLNLLTRAGLHGAAQLLGPIYVLLACNCPISGLLSSTFLATITTEHMYTHKHKHTHTSYE